jgi:hypothetical protein
MHACRAAVLLGVSGGNALESNAEPQPPDGELAQPVERVRGGKGDAVIGADGVGQPKILKGALKHAEGVALLRGRQRFAGEQVAGGVVGDREPGNSSADSAAGTRLCSRHTRARSGGSRRPAGGRRGAAAGVAADA